MPEIRRNLIGGKMNKDLDERLIPDGQYRDAMNVQVTPSDGSNVGSLQNILGNSLVPGQPVLNNAVCIASITEERSNSIYWFITSPTVDMILRFRDNIVTPVFADHRKDVLRFKFQS